VTQPQAYATSQAFMGMAIEATRGTAVPATFWPPMDTPQLTPNQTYLEDKDLRGSPVEIYDIVMGVRDDTMEWKGSVHCDSFPNLLRAALGSTDVKTGTVAPFTHTIGLLNAATTASQPPSYTLQYFNGFNCQQIAGAQCVDLTIDFTAMDAVKYTVKFQGQPFTVITTPVTEAYNFTDRIIPAWNNTLTLASVANTILVAGSLTIGRGTLPIQTQDGTQGPAVEFAGPCKVSGKLTFLVVTSEAIMADALASPGIATVIAFTDPSSTHSIALTMTKCQFKNPKYTTGKTYLEVDVDFEGVANSTDAISGFAPIKTATANAQSTTY
jgi:hypothetical protein